MTLVWQLQGVRFTYKYVLLAIADAADDHGVCYPSVEYLADKCSLEKRTVQRALTYLEKYEPPFLEIFKRLNPLGRRTSNLYALKLGGDSLTPQAIETIMGLGGVTNDGGDFGSSVTESPLRRESHGHNDGGDSRSSDTGSPLTDLCRPHGYGGDFRSSDSEAQNMSSKSPEPLLNHTNTKTITTIPSGDRRSLIPLDFQPSQPVIDALVNLHNIPLEFIKFEVPVFIASKRDGEVLSKGFDSHFLRWVPKNWQTNRTSWEDGHGSENSGNAEAGQGQDGAKGRGEVFDTTGELGGGLDTSWATDIIEAEEGGSLD